VSLHKTLLSPFIGAKPVAKYRYPTLILIVTGFILVVSTRYALCSASKSEMNV